mgnify:CR=1 FL=1
MRKKQGGSLDLFPVNEGKHCTEERRSRPALKVSRTALIVFFSSQPNMVLLWLAQLRSALRFVLILGGSALKGLFGGAEEINVGELFILFKGTIAVWKIEASKHAGEES